MRRAPLYPTPSPIPNQVDAAGACLSEEYIDTRRGGEVLEALQTLASVEGMHLHGSGTSVRWSDGLNLNLLHTKDRADRYVTLAYLVSSSPPFAITNVSRPLPLQGGASFASSLTLAPGGTKVVVGYGVADAEARALVMSRDFVASLFSWQAEDACPPPNPVAQQPVARPLCDATMQGSDACSRANRSLVAAGLLLLCLLCYVGIQLRGNRTEEDPPTVLRCSSSVVGGPSSEPDPAKARRAKSAAEHAGPRPPPPPIASQRDREAGAAASQRRVSALAAAAANESVREDSVRDSVRRLEQAASQSKGASSTPNATEVTLRMPRASRDPSRAVSIAYHLSVGELNEARALGWADDEATAQTDRQTDREQHRMGHGRGASQHGASDEAPPPPPPPPPPVGYVGTFHATTVGYVGAVAAARSLAPMQVTFTQHAGASSSQLGASGQKVGRQSSFERLSGRGDNQRLSTSLSAGCLLSAFNAEGRYSVNAAPPPDKHAPARAGSPTPSDAYSDAYSDGYSDAYGAVGPLARPTSEAHPHRRSRRRRRKPQIGISAATDVVGVASRPSHGTAPGDARAQDARIYGIR